MSTEVTQGDTIFRQTGGNASVGLPAPRAAWGEMGESEHFVQFYEDDGFLLDTLGDFVGAAVGSGEAAVIVATKEHRDGLEARLR